LNFYPYCIDERVSYVIFPDQDVVCLDDLDPTVGPLKAKGVGELGISGAPAAAA